MTDTLLDRLAVTDPAAHLPDYDAGQRARMLAHILEEDAAPARAVTPARGHRRRWVSVGVAAAVAAGMVAVPVGLELRRTDSGLSTVAIQPAGASAQAAELLAKAADVTPTDPPTRPGQFWKIVTTSHVVKGDGRQRHPGDLDAMTYFSATDVYTQFVPVDGSARRWYVDVQGLHPRYLIGDKGGPVPPSEESHYYRDFSPAELAGSWLNPTSEFFAALPRDPDALNARLHTWDGPDAQDPYRPSQQRTDGPADHRSTDDDAYDKAMQILSDGQAPADLRAAALRVLRLIPGVTVTDASARLYGRAGVALARIPDRRDDGRTLEQIVLDPADGTVIGFREEQLEDHGTRLLWKKGMRWRDQTFTRELVDSVPTSLQASATNQG